MNIKQKTLSTLLGIGLAALLSNSVLANEQTDSKSESGHSWSTEQKDQRSEHLKARLDKLAGRLEIKASQQAIWGEYVKSVEMVAEQNVKKPNDDADATTISRYRAERATEFAKKLNTISDATSKLQAVLTEDQQKIFNQISRHSHHERGHEWKNHKHCDREGSDGDHHMMEHRG